MCCVIFFCIPTKQPFIQVGPACFFSSSSSYIFSLSFDDWRWLRPSGRGGPRETLPEQSSFALHFPRLWILFFSLYYVFFLYRVNLHDGNEIEDEEFPLLAVAHVCCVGSLLLFVSRNEIDAGGRLHLNASRARGLNIELDVLLGGGNKTLSLQSSGRFIIPLLVCVWCIERRRRLGLMRQGPAP